MYDYLEDKTPDSPTITLSVTPQGTIYEDGAKNIEIHEADDDSEEAVILSTKTIFYVQLQWTAITEDEVGTIFDIYHDPDKACGTAKSIYWQHPTDGHTYVVKFRSNLKKFKLNPPIYGVATLNLKVIGRKPD